MEGRLLVGHAGSGSGGTGGGRQIVRRPAPGCGSRIEGQAAPEPGLVRSGAEVGVDLAGDVAFQAAHDFFLGQAFGGAPLDVGAGRGVGAHPGDHDPPQGVAGLPVAGGVEAVPLGLSGGGRDRTIPVIRHSIPLSSLVSLTAASTMDSPRSIAPPGTAQLSLSERRIIKTSPSSLTTTTFTEGTMLLAFGAVGSS